MPRDAEVSSVAVLTTVVRAMVANVDSPSAAAPRVFTPHTGVLLGLALRWAAQGRRTLHLTERRALYDTLAALPPAWWRRSVELGPEFHALLFRTLARWEVTLPREASAHAANAIVRLAANARFFRPYSASPTSTLSTPRRTVLWAALTLQRDVPKCFAEPMPRPLRRAVCANKKVPVPRLANRFRAWHRQHSFIARLRYYHRQGHRLRSHDGGSAEDVRALCGALSQCALRDRWHRFVTGRVAVRRMWCFALHRLIDDAEALYALWWRRRAAYARLFAEVADLAPRVPPYLPLPDGGDPATTDPSTAMTPLRNALTLEWHRLTAAADAGADSECGLVSDASVDVDDEPPAPATIVPMGQTVAAPRAARRARDGDDGLFDDADDATYGDQEE